MYETIKFKRLILEFDNDQSVEINGAYIRAVQIERDFRSDSFYIQPPGVWKGRLTLEQFIEKYSDKREHFDIIITAGSYFEYNAYESWGAKFMVRLNLGVRTIDYGPFPNLNAAEYTIDESRRKEQEKAGVDGSRIRDSKEI